MHATRHRNFQRRKQCSLTPILGVRIQNLPLPRTFSPSPCGFPSAASSPPHYSIALGARTDFSQELLQSALRLPWLLQPLSWLCSLRLCFGQSRVPSSPRHRRGTTPGSEPRGGRAQWARVGVPGKVGRYSGVLPPHWGCLDCADCGWGTPVCGSEVGHSAPLWQGLGQRKGAL